MTAPIDPQFDPRLARAIDLARALAAPAPDPARVEEVRTELLAAARATAPSPLRRRWRTMALRGLGVAAAASVIGALAMRPSAGGAGADAHVHGTVRPRPGASYLASSIAPDEIVVLFDGTIDVEVSPLHRGERFHVVVGGARVEVHGTAFAVTAHAGRLTDVVVEHGVVEVRIEGVPPRTLRGGEVWRDPGPVAEAPRAPEPVPPVVVPAPVPEPAPAQDRAPPKRRAGPATADPPSPPPPAAPATAAPEEDAYNAAWAAMRAGNFTRAASG